MPWLYIDFKCVLSVVDISFLFVGSSQQRVLISTCVYGHWIYKHSTYMQSMPHQLSASTCLLTASGYFDSIYQYGNNSRWTSNILQIELACNTKEGQVGVLDLHSQAYVTQARSHCDVMLAVVQSPVNGESRIATIGRDCSIKVWDVYLIINPNCVQIAVDSDSICWGPHGADLRVLCPRWSPIERCNESRLFSCRLRVHYKPLDCDRYLSNQLKMCSFIIIIE